MNNARLVDRPSRIITDVNIDLKLDIATAEGSRLYHDFLGGENVEKTEFDFPNGQVVLRRSECGGN